METCYYYYYYFITVMEKYFPGIAEKGKLLAVLTDLCHFGDSRYIYLHYA